MSINKAILVGRLGVNPELKNLDGGQSVCNFSVATSDTWTDKEGQRQEKTEWHRVTVWGKLAENCAQHLTKGREVYIEGRLQTREYDDPKLEGVKRYSTDIVANTVQFLGPKPEMGAVAEETAKSSGKTTPKPRK